MDFGRTDRGMDDGDQFGNLTDKFVSKNQMDLGSKYDDEPDSDEEDWVRPRGRRNKPYWFGTQMKNLCKEGKLKEAIEMLQIRMLKEERVKPIAYNYNILIGACGRAGYTKMAFKLYNDMKKRGILPVDVTYTALINACAESPWPTEDGIQRLRKLHGQMQEKNVNINLITHHALMKAYAKCGDVQMTFDLFRYLLASTPHVTAESCNFFFFACASQKEAGLTYAIQGWRYIRQRNIKLDKYSYNLLLRIARDCGIGDIDMANQVLLQRGQSQDLLQLPPSLPARARKSRKKSKAAVPINPESQRIEIFPINPISEENVESDDSEFLESDWENKDTRTPEKHTFWWQEEKADNKYPSQNALVSTVQTGEKDTNLPMSSQYSIASSVPNLLNASPKDLQSVVSLGSINTPQDRLALIGGCEGVLQSMEQDGVTPDIKTFGLLSGLIPHSKPAEKKLMVAMDAAGVKGDVDFYNGLIGEKALRRDIEGAKEIVSVLHSQGLFPTVKTYGNLAKGCYRSQDGVQLLEDMKATGKRPNIYIFSSLISAANKAKDYSYLVKVLNLMLEHQVQPNEQLLEKLENIASFHQNKAKVEESTGKRWSEKDEKQLNYFRKNYIPWLDKIKMAAKDHPWDKYRPAKYQRPVLNDRDI
ncbi:pentatricopeptide repeat-containing protein 1, mitochondrial-like [Amphiura filiformis]|uniref:pentatricopeptide repeat-containing protein 1, mitochondrial-like n=1 Tax=Amphiura filiformis TaxID=82378 RepID=UPI003B20E2B8